MPNGKHTAFFGIINSKRDHPERYQTDLNELFAMVQNQTLTPLIHAALPIEQTALAHQMLDQGRAVGNIIIKN